MKRTGVLMSCLLEQRDSSTTEDEFRSFLTDAVIELSRDLRSFDIELSVKSVRSNARPRNPRDWNSLHLGCE
jgi:hypothetical protein